MKLINMKIFTVNYIHMYVLRRYSILIQTVVELEGDCNNDF